MKTKIHIKSLDHLVITVKDVGKTIEFYGGILNMEVETLSNGKYCLHFGRQKINIHSYPGEFQPSASRPTEGSADLCFEAMGDMEDIINDLIAKKIDIEVGPVKRTGANGEMNSVYVRDPDGNLVEISVYE